MSAAYYDLYAEEDSLFVAKLNILTPEGDTAILKLPSPNPSNLKLYIPPEILAIGQVVTNITATMIIVPSNSSAATPSIIPDISIDLKSVVGDHNVIVSKKMPLGGSVIIPGTHYVYEFTLIFTTSTDSYKIRMMQGKFNYNKTITRHT